MANRNANTRQLISIRTACQNVKWTFGSCSIRVFARQANMFVGPSWDGHYSNKSY